MYHRGGPMCRREDPRAPDGVIPRPLWVDASHAL